MDPITWLEKAERLRSALALLRPTDAHDETTSEHLESIERVAIAHWLREEFAGEPPEDTPTLPLFVISQQ